MIFHSRIGFLILVKIPLLISCLFFVLGPSNVLAADCKVIAKDLAGNYSKTQDKGGIWALFERSVALKDKSMLGMQVDAKLRRAVSIFENYCNNDPEKATVPLAKQILAIIDEGRMLNNNSPDRVPAKKIIADVQSLIQKADQLINGVEK